MPKPTAQACHAMTTYYIGRYSDVVGNVPNVNRNKARYVFEALLMDHNKEYVKELIDFYVEHYSPDLEWFQWNYEKVVERHNSWGKEQEIVAERRRVTAERLAEWRRKKAEWQK